jgi:subtilisin-like proprotein convertase family protein
MKKIIILLLFFIAFSTIYAQNTTPWEKVERSTVSFSDKKRGDFKTEDQLFFRLDIDAFKQSLLTIQNKTTSKSGVAISIPNRNGLMEKFLVWESSNFDPELQAKYPDIRAYRGVGVTDANATLNFSLSPNGIQTMILRANSGSEFIESVDVKESTYVLFNSTSRNKGSLPFSCKTEDRVLNSQLLNKSGKIAANNQVFKTLRLALSCTGEYTAYHGGTKLLALAAMNETMTRVNGIFNKDLAVQLILIANNMDVIYIDSNMDPYSNSVNLEKWGLELQNNLTSTIGSANYDIGHLFGASGSGGNAGCIGCVCEDPVDANSKAKGSAYTSPSNGIPEGDAFDIDFVAHEFGHQLGANHTFSFDSAENTGVNVEPGSGSTLMGYAGITNYNVQDNSDDYFAYVSINQIQTNLASKSCVANFPLTNNPPTVNSGGNWTIPNGTAFILKGLGSDLDGDALTYCWEQKDSFITQSGASSIAFPTKVDGPLFRSMRPSGSAIRYMPSFSNVLANKLTTTWESVSSIARTLNFTLTARENAPAAGNGQTNTASMVVTVSGAVGPFSVTSQNTDNLSWMQGESKTITWTVNNSNTLVGSSNVNIKLSVDGGLTFSTTLVANTPNDGTENIVVPNVTGTNCRLLIEPVGNIYYAVNSKAFAIGYTVSSSCNTYNFPAPISIPDGVLTYTTRSISVPATTASVSKVSLNVGFTHAYMSDVQIELESPQGTIVRLFDRNCASTNSSFILNYDDNGGDLSCGTTSLQTVSPFQPLAIFNGQNPQGNWIFRVRDVDATKSGTINSASVTICTQSFTLGTADFEINDFVMYPNPNNGVFNIQFTSESEKGVKVFVHDILGRKLFEKEYSNKTHFNENVEMLNPQSGIYLLTVVDGNRKSVRKIVIE